MGEAIDSLSFSEKDERDFKQKLREETSILKKMLDQRETDHSERAQLGLEVEAWLVDKDSLPNPINRKFLKSCNNSDIVEEISQFNFEINTTPLELSHNTFSQLHKALGKTWEICRDKAAEHRSSPVMIGIHPMVQDSMLQPSYISDGSRYQALNDQILKYRKNKPIAIDIKGRDHFKLNLDHILIESAATSIQVHIQANQEDFKRVFNASLISSIPCVALAANSPFLYGHDLWDETRIPIFEQAVALKPFRNKKGKGVGRVTFGTGYLRHSILELFLENLDGYPPLMPILFDDPSEALHHLKFHNGTVWRWNRPIIGQKSDGKLHFRVEQRAMASGPSITDIVANTAFSVGLTQYFSTTDKIPEESMTFTDCSNNFYSAARKGFAADVRWFGKKTNLAKLILEDLLKKAKLGLEQIQVNPSEIDYYLMEVIRPRVISGQNGAQWQRAFINYNGRDFQEMAQQYLENQNSGTPVHQWRFR